MLLFSIVLFFFFIYLEPSPETSLSLEKETTFIFKLVLAETMCLIFSVMLLAICDAYTIKKTVISFCGFKILDICSIGANGCCRIGTLCLLF